MLKNYLVTGCRNLFKNMGYSLINIGGLAVGMAVAILIGLWVFDEVSFNRSFKNYERIGQVRHHVTWGEEDMVLSEVPAPMGEELKRSFVEFEEVTTASWPKEHRVSFKDKKLSYNGLFVEPSFTDIFSVKMLQGTSKTLENIHSILLSKNLAVNLLGVNAIGKMIKLNNRDQFIVTGVFEDFPYNSQFAEIEMLLPLNYYFTITEGNQKQMNNWNDYPFQCFVLMRDKAPFLKVEPKITDLLFKKSSADGKALNPKGFLFPMEKWHLYDEHIDTVHSASKIRFVWMFGIVGIFVILLACINFMNLSTARAERRSKEVGVRKVMGSSRRQLVSQFFSESLLVVVMSYLIALLVASLCLPWFNELTAKRIAIPLSNSYFILISLAFIVITGVLSSSYPALYLSSFNPIKVLKGTFRSTRFAALPRKVMVVFQFTTSISLIIATVVVFLQIEHGKDRPVGFDREGIIHVATGAENLAKADYNTIRNALLSTGAVENMATSDFPITGNMSGDPSITWEGKDPATVPLVATNSCSHDFPSTNGFQFIAGRDFSRTFSTDSSAVIINEMAAKLISLTNDVLGKKIKLADGKEREIIGVIKDQVRWAPFVKHSPHIYFINYAGAGYLTIRLNPHVGVQDGLRKIKTVIEKYAPATPFEYQFLDDDYAENFKDEERIGELASVFAVLTVFISCIGIFGLAAFAASQRTKEIGIRKILGASVLNLWRMLSFDFVRLITISILVATPLAYYFAEQWLQQYEYRIEIYWWIFVATGVLAIAITLLTVSYQSINAALANPVQSLRSE